MKHVFLFGVLVFSWLAICNCKHDLSPSHVTTNSQTGQEKQVPPQEGEAEENEHDGTPDTIPQVVVPPETIPQEIEKEKDEDDKPPVMIPPEVVLPEDGTQGIKTGEGETPQGGGNTEDENDGTPETVPPETIPPVVIPPQVVIPEDGNQENDPEEGETIETETTEIENPVDGMSDLAILQINELRTEFSNAVNNVEYIEFKVIKGGGMEGLHLYCYMNNAQDIFMYIFPPIDVETGEYITLHLRTLDKYNSCDELRDDLTISGGYESCPTARDLWVSGSTKLIDKTCIVYIQDVNGKIMDAIIMDEKPSDSWNSYPAFYADITERLFKEGMWKSAEGNKPKPKDSVNTSTINSSVYKSVSRYEDRKNTHSTNDWYITIPGFYSPGQPNN